MGAFLNKQGSLTPESLQTFYDSPDYRMGDDMVPRGGWKLLDQFFARTPSQATVPSKICATQPSF